MIAKANLLRTVILGLVLFTGSMFVPALPGGIVGVEAAQAQRVAAISVSGNQRVDNSTVVSFLALRVGDTATQSLIDESIDSLYQSGLFSAVEVRMAQSTLVVVVSENPIISGVLFRGNNVLNDDRLAGLVDLSSLGVFSDAGAERGVRSIKQAYEKDGYRNIDVSYEVEVLGNARVRVTYVIVEGERAGIAAINFVGNQGVSDWTLASIVKTRQTNILSWILRDDNFDQDKLDLDSELIRLYYVNHGYPDARVLSAVAEFDPDRRAYHITFTIEEGDRYRFGPVGIETSIATINTASLEAEIRTRPGNQYSFEDIQRTAQEMALAAADQGYAFAEVRPRIDRNIADQTFSVTYLVDEGARLYVQRINIFGNNKTRDFVIRREFDFAEGDPLNRSLVQRGQQNLEGLGLFESVQVGLEPGTGSDLVIINVVVKERSSGEYGATAGWSTDEGILGELSLVERNFLGRGQYLKVSVGLSATSRTFDFSFTEPRFMGLDIAVGLDVYRRVVEEGSPFTFGTDAIGGQLRATLPIFDNLDLTGFVGGEQKVITDTDADTLGGYPLGTFNKAFVGYRLAYSDVDNPNRPAEGITAQLSQQYVGIDHNLLKTEAKARFFYPLNMDAGIVGSIRAQAGIINDFSGGGAHPTEAFTLGPQLVRGFAANGFGPRDSDGNALGATEYAGLSAEVEFPLPMVPESYGLSGAIWTDAAMVGGDSHIPGLTASGLVTPVKGSAGVSVVWDSPFGPLRGNYIPFVYGDEAGDVTQQFQLTISSIF